MTGAGAAWALAAANRAADSASACLLAKASAASFSARASVCPGEQSASCGMATKAEVWNSASSTSPAAIDVHSSASKPSSASSGPPRSGVAAPERAESPALFAEWRLFFPTPPS